MNLSLEAARIAIVLASQNLPKGAVSTDGQRYTIEANDQLLKAIDYRDLVLAWRNRKRVRILRAAACVAALALLCWWAFPAFVEMYWLRLSYSAEYLFTATERVLSGRVASWRML